MSLTNAWREAQLRHLVSTPIQNGLGEAAAEGDPSWPRYIRITDIVSMTELDPDKVETLDPEIAGKAPVRRGDLLCAAVGASVGTSYLHESDEAACYAGYLVRIRPDLENLEPRFLGYWAQSAEYWHQIRAGSIGSTIENFSASRYRSMRISIPEVGEQRRIAEFLDRESAQIDELIAKQEQLISTLAERRTSVILNGVARGLFGVELKESGADWLGKVPAHWRVRRLKYSVRFSKNGVWGDEPDGGESDVWVIRVADFDRVRRTVTKDKQTYRKVLNSDRAGRLLAPGDLVLEKSGGGEKSPVGFVAIYEDSEPALTSNFVARLRLEPDCDSRYWLYVHAALYASRVTERSIKQTSGIQNLDQSSYFNELAPFPPLEEQRSIAREIDARLDAILAAASKAELLIDRLRERRRALISAAVTGQIDVGGAS